MTASYSTTRILEALEQSKHDAEETEILIMNWLKSDQRFLIGLVAPHIRSIVQHAIARQQADVQSESSPAPAIDVEAETSLFESLLSGGMKNNQSFGDLDEPATRPGKASKAHIDALKTIASKQSENKET